MRTFMHINLQEVIEFNRERLRSIRKRYSHMDFKDLTPIAFTEMSKGELSEQFDPYKHHLQVFPENPAVSSRIRRIVGQMLEDRYLKFSGLLEFWAHLAPSTYAEAVRKGGEITPDTVMLKVYYEERDVVKLVAKY